MRALLIHNPKAGDRKHGKKQLVWSLKKKRFSSVLPINKGARLGKSL